MIGLSLTKKLSGWLGRTRWSMYEIGAINRCHDGRMGNIFCFRFRTKAISEYG